MHWFSTILQGIGIGAANVIPGVSGGTMALIFGIYEKLIAVAAGAVRAGLLLLRFELKLAIAELAVLPWGFVLPLVLGIAAAPIAGARFIPELLESFPQESRGMFFGLILGSIAIPWLRIVSRKSVDYVLLLVAAAIAFVIAGIPAAAESDPSLVFVFVAGAIAMSAMILPGVSGAYLLLIMGLYAPILTAVKDFDIVIILVFMAGAGIGVGAFSIFVGWLLKRAHDRTMAVLVGLMIGSLRALWPWLGSNREFLAPELNATAYPVLGLMIVGFLISAAILVWERRQKGKEDQA
jgi:putative membrane protein